jgi:SHS2 domain-containing protein
MVEPDARTQRFELRAHTADVAVEASAATLSGVFASVADGLAAAHVETVPDLGERFELELEAESREALLFDYLDRLIYERDVRDVLPVDNHAEVTHADEGWQLAGSARGVPVSAIDAREVKAVTYSEMALEETPDGWRAYVVFDV